MVDKDKYYDGIINVAIINFFTLGKETKVLVIENYDKKNLSHKCILKIANIVHNVFGYEIKLKLSPLNFIKFKLKNRKTEIKRFKKGTGTFVDINKFINDIEEANKDKGVFREIYKNFYEENN